MDMLAALRLQIEWGADEALDDLPIDRTAPAPVAAPTPQPASQAAIQPASRRPADTTRAEIAAEEAHTLEALYRIVAAFPCPLAATATSTVMADGNPEAGLVLIGEAPGNEEDASGRPFQGPAGQLLDRMMASIGLSRADMLLTNVLPWRPPGNRAPSEAEVQLCAPFLWRHLTLLRPRTVVALGALPARLLTGRRETIHKLRGRWTVVTIPGLPAPVSALPMLHPATVARSPAAKKDAWTDLIALRRHLIANKR